MSVRQSAVLVKSCEGHARVGSDVSSVRDEIGCFLWVIQQSKVVGCLPRVQAFIITRCFAVASVDILAVEVINVQTEL